MTTQEDEPFLDNPPAYFVDGDVAAYALVGTLVKNEKQGAPDSYHLLAGESLSRPIDERLVPLYEWFSIPRSETQVREWLKWADAPAGFLDMLVKGGSIAKVNSSGAWKAAKSLRGLRLAPLSFPDFDSPAIEGFVAVKRTLDSRDDETMTVELAEVLWGDRKPEDVPTAISALARRQGVNREIVAQYVLAGVPRMLRHGYIRLEPLND
jgi:hypothetical protein